MNGDRVSGAKGKGAETGAVVEILEHKQTRLLSIKCKHFAFFNGQQVFVE